MPQVSNTKPLTISERVWGRADLNLMNGYLPLQMPYCLEGDQFKGLNNLLDEMPVIKKDGSAGLIASNTFRMTAASLDDHADTFLAWAQLIEDETTAESEKNKLAMDLAVAFRDYQYLKMGYLFEPIYHGAAQGSEELPPQIANPLVLLAQLFGQKPWLEYASGYVLMNSIFGQQITADKVELIRQWHGGPDEFYFQTVHSIIEWETPKLFKAIHLLLDGVEHNKDAQIVQAVQTGIDVSQTMLAGLKQMTKLSRPAFYSADVRPQIQGLVGNCGDGKLFGEKGVLYNSRFFADQQPKYINDIRGQTGAQSSIIPLLDNILGITDFYAKGDNPLTKMLREFRAYRPKPHTELLELVEKAQNRLQVRQYLKAHYPLLLAQWTNVVCQFREFHFYLAMAYIVKPGKAQPQSQSRGVGTGGSPTPKYLPQHVSESIDALKEALAAVDQTNLCDIERNIFNQLDEYAQKTAGENKSRSEIVGQYLEDSSRESLLDDAIQSSKDKMETETEC